jgi:hypothetical protein
MRRRCHLAARHVLIGSLALALAGCGTTAITNARSSPAPRAAVVSHALPPQQAKAEAAAILAVFIPPPGAQRLAASPGGVGGKLDNPIFMSGDPDTVYSASLWKVQGMSPLQVLAWEKAHLPDRFRLTLTGGEAAPARPGIPGVPTPPSDPYHDASDEFDLQGVGIPPAAEMIVQAATSSAGQTYVRVDVQVSWQPQRPASERVPAGVTAITITAQPDMNKPHDVPAPVTLTDPARVGKIVRLVDSLPLNAGGGHCSLNENGKGITLSFLGHASGPVLATASELIGSCGGVEFAIRGTDEPVLSDPGSFTRQALSIAGVRWPGFNMTG